MVEEVPQEMSETVERLNEQLGSMPYRLAIVNPRELQLAKKNARFMKSETFKSLVANIKRDGNLSSVPFCFRDKEGRYHVLSGNHRVQAAIQADVEKILIFYREDLDHDERVSIQLSHNAIEGEDDLAILKELWDSIADLDLKLYAGLDSITLEKLDKVEFQAISEARLDYRSVSFLFLPEEVERAEEIFERIHVLFGKEDLYVFSMEKWEQFFAVISEIKTRCNLKNSAAAFAYLLDLAEEKLAETKPEE
jgi:hypothetical protein